MKLLKFTPLLLVLTLFNSSSYAGQHCDEIKGNIVGKLFCKAQSNMNSGSVSNTSETSSSSGEKSSGWKIWKKPEWMKKKN